MIVLRLLIYVRSPSCLLIRYFLFNSYIYLIYSPHTSSGSTKVYTLFFTRTLEIESDQYDTFPMLYSYKYSNLGCTPLLPPLSRLVNFTTVDTESELGILLILLLFSCVANKLY